MSATSIQQSANQLNGLSDDIKNLKKITIIANNMEMYAFSTLERPSKFWKEETGDEVETDLELFDQNLQEVNTCIDKIKRGLI